MTLSRFPAAFSVLGGNNSKDMVGFVLELQRSTSRMINFLSSYPCRILHTSTFVQPGRNFRRTSIVHPDAGGFKRYQGSPMRASYES